MAGSMGGKGGGSGGSSRRPNAKLNKTTGSSRGGKIRSVKHTGTRSKATKRDF